MSTATSTAIKGLIALEPGISRLLARAVSISDDNGDHFCADEAWAGYGAFVGRGLKREISEIVGWDRFSYDKILSSAWAYEEVCRAVLALLPDCRNCGCWFPQTEAQS